MTSSKPVYLFLLVFLATRLPVAAQGCSDAGFCTIGALKQHAMSDQTKQKITGFATKDWTNR